MGHGPDALAHPQGAHDPAEWTPRELRHGFISLPSDAGVLVENTARLVGHTGIATTELVYRARQDRTKMLQSVAIIPGTGKSHVLVSLGVAAVQGGA